MAYGVSEATTRGSASGTLVRPQPRRALDYKDGSYLLASVVQGRSLNQDTMTISAGSIKHNDVIRPVARHWSTTVPLDIDALASHPITPATSRLSPAACWSTLFAARQVPQPMPPQVEAVPDRRSIDEQRTLKPVSLPPHATLYPLKGLADFLPSEKPRRTKAPRKKRAYLTSAHKERIRSVLQSIPSGVFLGRKSGSRCSRAQEILAKMHGIDVALATLKQHCKRYRK